MTGHLVQIEFKPGGRRYTYAWSGNEQLDVGDEVLVPAGYWSMDGAHQVAKIVDLSSDYRGSCVRIISKRSR